jgi:ribonuclease D
MRADLVTSPERLAELCETWRKAGRFAFDTEFIRDETFDAQLCLLQVACEDEVVLIDPLEGLDLKPFWELVTNPALTTIVHAGKEDFEICLRESGSPPRNVFDVQIAAGFVGVGYPLSLSRLVDGVLQTRVTKGQTMTDWSRRPLTDEQLQYAVDDVRYLPRVHAKLTEKLRKARRATWAKEEFARFESAELYKPPPEDRLFKLKGAKKLEGVSLVVLARLIEWRDAWAARKNRPIRSLCRDDVLVEIARRKPKRAAQLEVLRGFSQSRNKQVVGELLELVAEAVKTPRADWPQAHVVREETPMMRAVTDILSAVLRANCYTHGVAQELVGSTQRLRELVDFSLNHRSSEPPLLQGWRGKFIGHKLLDILDGDSEVHLTGWPKRPRVHVITANGSD